MARQRKLRALWCWSGFVVLTTSLCTLAATDEEPRARLLEQMRGRADQTRVRLVRDDRTATMVANPVFRYDDQPRHFIDATMWVWTDGGRPVAFQKIEAVVHADTGQSLWGYCFTSLANQPLAVTWGDARPYATTAAGLGLQRLPVTLEPPAMTATARKLQMNRLSRGFSARILLNPRTNDSSEMRLLPKAIYEFSDPESKQPLGAVYGFSSNGTNPDLLVMLQVITDGDRAVWQFAPVRMTTGGLKLRFEDEPVWEAEFVSPHAGPFPTWTFFRTARDEPGS